MSSVRHEHDELRSDQTDARIQRQEAAALESLRRLGTAQIRAQTEVRIDVDNDGNGEFGYIAELSGEVLPRGRERRKRDQKPLLTSEWDIDKGRAAHQGYVFRVWLPDRDLLPVAEGEGGGEGERPAGPKTSSVMWLAYAWPLENEVTGRRAFCINQDGVIFATDNLFQRYSGDKRTPKAVRSFRTQHRDVQLEVEAGRGLQRRRRLEAPAMRRGAAATASDPAPSSRADQPA